MSDWLIGLTPYSDPLTGPVGPLLFRHLGVSPPSPIVSVFPLISNSTRRTTHEGLVEAHRVLVNAFTEATKRPYTDIHEPIVASSASPSILPLVQSDYPAIKYWSKLDWKKTENIRRDSSDLEAKGGGRGGARSSKGKNVMMLYIENADGSPIDGALASSIREFARLIWREFHSQGIAPEKWGDAPRDVRDRYCYEMETAFVVLRYCEDHWKAHAVATAIYSQWYHVFNKKKNPAIKEEPARKKSKTSTNDSDINDAQSPQQPNASESAPKIMTLDDPLYVSYTPLDPPSYAFIAAQMYSIARHLHSLLC